jgi:hypothetical protein
MTPEERFRPESVYVVILNLNDGTAALALLSGQSPINPTL